MDAVHVLQQAIKENRAHLTISTSDVVRLALCEARPKDGLVALLFRRSDPNASTPFFENSSTRAIRKSDKKDEEAVTVAAHLFISASPIKGRPQPTYRAIIEEMPGLGRTYMHDIIKTLIREHKYKFSDKHGEEKDTYSIVDMDGVKSENLSNVLSESSIQYVTLSRPGKISGMDSEGLFSPRTETLNLYVEAKSDMLTKALEKIGVFQKKHGWDKMIVRVDLPENRSRNVAIERDVSAAETLFIRAEQIDVSKPLDVCTEVINGQLVAKAKEMFARKDWT